MGKTLALSVAALIFSPAHGAAPKPPGASAEPVTLTVIGTYSDGSTGNDLARMYYVVADADSDGDGKMDEGMLTLKCPAGGNAATGTFKPAARDSASGMASGKRQYQPIPIRRLPDGSVSPAPAFKGSWDMATLKGGRGASAAHATRVVTFPASFSGCRGIN